MNKTTPKPFLSPWIILTGIILFGFLTRFLSFETPFFSHHEDDWAVFGIQANDMFTGLRFRPFMYRQYYMGIFPLFFDLINFSFLGVSHTAMFMRSVFIFPAYCIALYLLSRKIFSSTKAGLFSALAAAVMPYIAYNICPQPALGYLDNMTLGLFVFLITLNILNTEHEKYGLWIILGFLGGLGLWTSFFAGYFLLPAFLILLAAKTKRFFGSRPYAALASFIAGSLPFWYFNFVPYRKMSSLGVFGSGHNTLTLKYKISYFIDKLQMVLGFEYDNTFTTTVHLLAVLVAAAAFIYFITALKKQPFREFLKHPRNAGILLLLAYLGLIIYGNLSSSKYAGASARYIYPVYPFVQIMLGAFFAFLATKKRILCYLAVSLWFLSQGINLTIQNPRLLKRQEYKNAYAQYKQTVQQITQLAKQHGAGLVATTNKWDAMVFEFDSIGSGVYYVEPLSPLHPEKAIKLLLQPQQLRLAHLYHINRFKHWLTQHDYTFKSRPFGKFVDLPLDGYRYEYEFFYDIKRKANKLAPILPSDITISASQDRENVSKLTDANINTRWFAPQKTNAEITFEFKTPRKVKEIFLFSQTLTYELPALLQIQTSQDGKNWTAAQAHLVQTDLYPIFNQIVERPRSGIVNLTMQNQLEARYLKISALAANTPVGWNTNEITLFAQTDETENEAFGPQLLEILKNNNVHTVYADEVAAALVLEKTDLRCFNEYTWDVWSKRTFAQRSVNLENKTALVCPVHFAPFTAMSLEKLDIEYKKFDCANRIVFVLPSREKTSGLYWLSLWASTCIETQKSYNTANKADELPETNKNNELKAELFKQALRLDPYNIFAAQKLYELDPSYTSGLEIKKYTPANNLDIVFKDLMTITGYTLEDSHLKVFATSLGRYEQDHGRILLYGLSPDGQVRYSKEAPSFSGKAEPFLSNGQNVLFKNQRLVYRFDLSGNKPDTTYWICFVDANNKRCEIESVNGKPCDKNRTKLF